MCLSSVTLSQREWSGALGSPGCESEGEVTQLRIDVPIVITGIMDVVIATRIG